MEKKTIGAFIAVLRKANGMTQKSLADRLGVSDKAVSRWERDECAPDLSLIPVIAEIFGITADELLRGEKNPAGAVMNDYQAEKTEKQIQNIADKTKMNFKIFSIISVSASFIGFLSAMICNFGFLRGYVGFFVACIFTVAAVICESVFIINSFSKIKNHENKAVADCKLAMFKTAVKAFSAVALIFSLSFPLLLTGDAYAGIALKSYFWLVLISILAALIAVFAGVRISSDWAIKNGIYALDENEKVSRKNLGKLKLKCALITAAALAVTGIGQIVFNEVTNPWDFARGGLLQFNDYEDFTRFMELDREHIFDNAGFQYAGEELYEDAETVRTEIIETDKTYTEKTYNQDDCVVNEKIWRKEKLFSNNGKLLCTYVHRNHQVVHIDYADNASRLPITVYTQQDEQRGRQINSIINYCFIPFYLAEAGAGISVYFKKRKKIA